MSTSVETRAPAGGPAAEPRPAGPRRPVGRTVLRYAVLIALALIFVSPIIFMVLTSFKERGQAAGYPPTWIPDPFTTQAYETIFATRGTPVLRWFTNSLVAAVANAALVVITSALAAYALARMHFRGQRLVFAAVVLTLFVPPVILIIPNYLIVGEPGLAQHPARGDRPDGGLGLRGVLPAAVLPRHPGGLEEAARIDGAHQWQIFSRIVLPLARPALATLALLSLLTNWNDFLWPVYVLFSADMQTLPAGLSTLQTANSVRYDLLMAGAVIASVPVLLLYVFLQRFIIEGVSRSGVKG